MQGKLRAAMVTDVGGIGDESFNASAWRGLQRAQKELGAEVRYLESRTAADYVRNLTTLARQGFNVVFAVGFLMEDALARVAPRFPKTYFGIVDGKAPNLPNCVSLVFNEQEGSYLVGALAGAMTKRNIVGFIGGMNVPLIKKFEYGYRAGVLTTNAQARVLVGLHGQLGRCEQGARTRADAVQSGRGHHLPRGRDDAAWGSFAPPSRRARATTPSAWTATKTTSRLGAC
jgi:basic membrane protein A